LKREGVTSNLT